MNCLQEIKLNSNVNEWCLIPGENRPADQCTRCKPLTSLTLNSFWINGPQFLHKNQSFCFESAEAPTGKRKYRH